MDMLNGLLCSVCKEKLLTMNGAGRYTALNFNKCNTCKLFFHTGLALPLCRVNTLLKYETLNIITESTKCSNCTVKKTETVIKITKEEEKMTTIVKEL
jgi:hypothetical protein